MLNELIDKQLYDALDELEDLDFSVIENRLLDNLYRQLIEKTTLVLDATDTYFASSVVLFFLFFESLCFPLCLSVVY